MFLLELPEKQTLLDKPVTLLDCLHAPSPGFQRLEESRPCASQHPHHGVRTGPDIASTRPSTSQRNVLGPGLCSLGIGCGSWIWINIFFGMTIVDEPIRSQYPLLAVQPLKLLPVSQVDLMSSWEFSLHICRCALQVLRGLRFVGFHRLDL